MKSMEDIFESLIKMGGKKIGDSIKFIKPSLAIKNKDLGVKYTVSNVGFDENNNPFVICYRYYAGKKRKNKKNKKMFIKILKKDFKNYEPV
tara:strand:+ start:109 stop:381 length:273 start_codon:yes stop_codon:yes gene_type:complete